MALSKQVIAKARELSEQGLCHADIAAKMADLGYVSSRTGKMYAKTSITYILSKPLRKSRAASKAAPIGQKKTRASFGKASAIISILKLKGMDAEERIALALLVLD